METEKRLIDANALLEAGNETKMPDIFPDWLNMTIAEQEAACKHGRFLKNLIQKLPTVDAVEVVRCKDCTFWTYEGIGSSTMKRFGSCAKWYPFGNEQHSCYYDDFCSYGERKDNGK